MELNEYVTKCHQTAKDKGFWDTKREFGTLLMLIVSELGEALEADRKGHISNYDLFWEDLNNISLTCPLGVFNSDSFERHIKDGVIDEIADTFIRLFDLCGGLGINIEQAINLKMNYNSTREKLHGKKY